MAVLPTRSSLGILILLVAGGGRRLPIGQEPNSAWLLLPLRYAGGCAASAAAAAAPVVFEAEAKTNSAAAHSAFAVSTASRSSSTLSRGDDSSQEAQHAGGIPNAFGQREDDAGGTTGAVATTSPLARGRSRIVLPTLSLDVRRALQGTDAVSTSRCPSEAAAARACLDAAVGGENTTKRAECTACYNRREDEALEEYRKWPTRDCKLLNDNVCTSVSFCPCLEPCNAQVSALFDCQLRASFADVGVSLTCAVSCQGPASSASLLTDDEVGGGYCGGEERSVKACVEAATSAPYADCRSCLAPASAPLRLTNATACAELIEDTCLRVAACPCVADGCRAGFAELRNCWTKVVAIDLPHLSDCVLDGQCSAMPLPALSQSQSQSPATSPAPGPTGAASSPSSPALSQPPSSSGGAGEGDGSDPSAAAPFLAVRFRAATTILASAVTTMAMATATTFLS